jgi:hypothetical protein
VAERVVHALELVEVDGGEQRRPAGGEDVGQRRVERSAVRQPGQGVVVREVLQIADRAHGTPMGIGRR